MKLLQSFIIYAVMNNFLHFEYNANESRYKSIDYTLKAMKKDSSLITNAEREQFMQDKEDENIGLFSAVTDSIGTGNVIEAAYINTVIVDTNLMESNLKSVNDIIISWKHGNVHTATDTIFLESISEQDPVTGGKAVYLARGALRKRIVDRSIGAMRFMQPTPVVNHVTNLAYDGVVFPNPTTGKVYIQLLNTENSIAEIKVLDLTGRELQRFLFKKSNYFSIDLTNLVAGAYTLQIKDNTGLAILKQIILIK